MVFYVFLGVFVVNIWLTPFFFLPFSLFVLCYGCSCIHVHQKNVSGGARQAILRSLDSAVSSILALISTKYAQLV